MRVTFIVHRALILSWQLISRTCAQISTIEANEQLKYKIFYTRPILKK